MQHPTNFDKMYFHFHLFQSICNFSENVFLWPMSYLKVCFLNFMYLGIFFFICFSVFLTSSLIPYLSNSRHFMIIIILNLLKCVLWSRMWFILMNVPCELEKNVYFAITGWSRICQLYPVDWWCCGVQLCLFWSSVCWICPLLIEECWSFQMW